jgi:hypothetical protein
VTGSEILIDHTLKTLKNIESAVLDRSSQLYKAQLELIILKDILLDALTIHRTS